MDVLAPAETYHQLAADWVSAYESDPAALARLNTHYEREFTLADLKAEIWRRVYAFRQRSSRVPKNYLDLSEGRLLLAQDAGFGSWEALLDAATHGAPPAPDFYDLDTRNHRIAPRRRLSSTEWARLVDIAREHRVTAIHANGLMTDAVMARIAALDCVTEINLGGSRELTDDGLLQLARMPQLETLNLSEYPGGRLTDRGLEVLRHLPGLRNFEMTWQSGITDKGASNLRFCDRLEHVNLMGSPTGDGVIEALAGKAALANFRTGRLVTDAGLPFLHQFPRLKTWQGGELRADLKEPPNGAGRLLLDGPFTDRGLASLAGLEGLAELDLFWHVSAITPGGFAHLSRLPNLVMLGCDGELSCDEAMVHIGAIPNLRSIRIQETTATDAGFESLSRSTTLAFIWGRQCPHLGNRGFLALSRMPNLRGLGVGLQKVDDTALAALPDFPALRELTPVGMQDDGFRHVGRCAQLERLTCMYCRDTTDAATAHIDGLALRYYYAGLTRITDRSLELLGRMSSLEQVDLYECLSVTDAGLPFLAALPRLREVNLDGLPGVTLAGTRIFPPRVRVGYTT